MVHWELAGAARGPAGADDQTVVVDIEGRAGGAPERAQVPHSAVGPQEGVITPA